MSYSVDKLAQVSEALKGLRASDFRESGRAFLATLGYSSHRTLDAGGDPRFLLDAVGIEQNRLDLSRWKSFDLLFQLTGDELPALSRNAVTPTGVTYQQRTIDSFVFLSLDLQGAEWSRRELVKITRDLNRGFDMPAIILFRYGHLATLAVIDRRQNLRDSNRDVIGGRVSLVKDIDLNHPHRAHVEILSDLSFTGLKATPADFRGLYDAWLSVLSASELNKRFYKELADWFAWASAKGVVHFPAGQGNEEGERQTGLIRLLTRLMFVWFVKQKGLIPNEFFERASLEGLLTEDPYTHPEAHGYYLSILQNLFFACLNTEGAEREWLPRNASGGSSGYLVHNKLRQKQCFVNPDLAAQLFKEVPFLNGGLFDCLDEELDESDTRTGRATIEGRGRKPVLRVDGFSEESTRQPRLPNQLFFGGQAGADLSHYYGKPTRRSVKGLIDLFDSYKFTIEENTPLEEEAALDPELLGKVFENLLASYNDDTKTTARNKSGSFYTPREVVDFMVDEALVPYLAPHLGATDATEIEARLRKLLSFTETEPEFTNDERDALIKAIEQCKAIDPAVGSGAFPLGLLQKLVHVLHRLDPDNAKWKARNRAALERYRLEAEELPSFRNREEQIADADRKLAEFDASFQAGTADYARKLYLIEGCLYGVDIQPIAIQIAKLRCFIALAVEQNVDNALPNRGITPLPNLEMKFVAANALAISRQGHIMMDSAIQIERRLRKANAAFFSARSRSTKKSARNDINRLRRELSESLTSLGFSSDQATALASWNPFNANEAAGFFDPQLMFGLEADGSEGCFDVVFANPPYIRQERIDKQLKERLKIDYPDTFIGTADLYVYFYERCIRLLAPKGSLALITSNKWYRLAYGKKLRTWLSKEMRLSLIIDFGNADVFEAIAYPTILVAIRRDKSERPYETTEPFRALNWQNGQDAAEFAKRFYREAFDLSQRELSSAPDWQIVSPITGSLLARIRNTGQHLKSFLTSPINRGITTGYNPAFELSQMERSIVLEDPSSEQIVKPLLKGRDLQRWLNETPTNWILFMRRGIDLSLYPSAERHLARYRSKLEPKPKDFEGEWEGRKPGSYKWWEIQDNVSYWPIFEQNKLISNKVTDKPTFSIDFQHAYIGNTAYCFTADKPLYLLAVLNSSTSAYISKRIFADKEGGFYEVQPDALNEFPIPFAQRDQEVLINTIVKAVIEGAQPLPLFESLLNAFVYELFFPAELAERNLSPFGEARGAGLASLAEDSGKALAMAVEEWSRVLTDTRHPMYATLFALQSIEVIRIIEGR